MLNRPASVRCSGDNKEKFSTNIRSEYASDFCHDRKSALKDESWAGTDFKMEVAPTLPELSEWKIGSCEHVEDDLPTHGSVIFKKLLEIEHTLFSSDTFLKDERRRQILQDIHVIVLAPN